MSIEDDLKLSDVKVNLSSMSILTLQCVTILTYISVRMLNPSNSFSDKLWKYCTDILLDKKLLKKHADIKGTFLITEEGLIMLQKFKDLFDIE